jgi:hypothetical protein
MKKESVFRHLYQMNHTNEDIASPRWECLDSCNNFNQLNPTEKLIWLMAVDNPDILTRISNMVQKANV